jgi:hypothetical protein
MSKDVLVQALIDCDKAPYTSENEDELRSLSEATLEATLDAFGSADEEEEDQTPNPDDASVTEAEDADPEPMTEEEWFAHAPESLRGLAESSNDIANIVNEHRQREQAERKDLITRVSEATDAYSAEALKGKTTEDLRSLAKALNVNKPAPDFSLQSETFDREPSENDVPEVRSMSERFAAN